jgi:hypothetical protein
VAGRRNSNRGPAKRESYGLPVEVAAISARIRAAQTEYFVAAIAPDLCSRAAKSGVKLCTMRRGPRADLLRPSPVHKEPI